MEVEILSFLVYVVFYGGKVTFAEYHWRFGLHLLSDTWIVASLFFQNFNAPKRFKSFSH